jgi:sugar phosphate isomerase/epimerase
MFRLVPILFPAAALFALAGAAQPDTRLKNPFFAFSNGLEGTPEAMAQALHDLGYAGMDWEGDDAAVPKLLTALESRGLALASIYRSPHDDIPGTLKLLKGKGTLILLHIDAGEYPNDSAAVIHLRTLAAQADSLGLKLALYPHVDSYVGKQEDGLRLCQAVNRKNVGLCFNLCHFLMECNRNHLDARALLGPLLARCRPYLFTTAINGADSVGTSWNKLIQPLGRGNFPVFEMVKTLVDLGFMGPIGLQCYAVPGDKMTNLATSMAAWQGYQKLLPVTTAVMPGSPYPDRPQFFFGPGSDWQVDGRRTDLPKRRASRFKQGRKDRDAGSGRLQ